MNEINKEPEKLYADCHTMGGMSKYAFEDDPKRLAFTLARYKHTAKLLEGFNSVLEIGCSDGFGSRIVRQSVLELVAIDIDKTAIDEAQKNTSNKWPIRFVVGDVNTSGASDYKWDAIYALDVLEHIPPSEEKAFLTSLRSMTDVCVIGMPSLESQVHASRLSKDGHVNCQSGPKLKATLKKHWGNVFMFSMHDEALGTGFLPMAQYLLALCVK